MSVTIRPVGPGLRPFPACRVEQPCQTCARGICQPGWCEDGTEIVREPTAPEANMANGNARAVFEAIGVDLGEYLCGDLAPNAIAPTLAVVERMLQAGELAERRRSGLVRTPEAGVGDGGARVISCGTSDGSVQLRLYALQAVLFWAQNRGCAVSWD